MNGNTDKRDFRRTHFKKLGELGRVVRAVAPIPAQSVKDHARRYIFIQDVDFRDVLLHSVSTILNKLRSTSLTK